LAPRSARSPACRPTSPTRAWPRRAGPGAAGHSAACPCCARSRSATPGSSRSAGRPSPAARTPQRRPPARDGAPGPAGARGSVAASNPLSTQDDVAAALADAGTFVFARAGVDATSYAEHIHRVLDPGPDLVIDDGGDLVDTLAGRPELAGNVRGGCESTSTGVLRLRRMAAAGALAFPMVAADATTTKRMFDSTAPTAQSLPARALPA